MIFPDIMSFVDVETTGMSSHGHRIIEIGILRVEHGEIVDTFESLVNPELPISEDISLLTGIYTQDILNAPVFSDIKQHVLDLLDGAVFVAHNVSFDYGFVQAELKRTGVPFRAQLFDTVKLFRALYPEGRHSLDHVIERLGISVNRRHRAWDDAEVLWKLINHVHKTFPEKRVLQAIDAAMRTPRLPQGITPSQIHALPEGPGVYLMYADTDIPIYIGKSVNIKSRVLSHFSDSTKFGKEFKIASQVKHIETIETAGELPALLLESELIKKHQPLYNRQLRQRRKMILVTAPIIEDAYIKVQTQEVSSIDIENLPDIIQVCKSKKQVDTFLNEMGKTHHLCAKLLGIEKGQGACFWHQLGWCKGACIGKESKASYNMRFTLAVSKYKFKKWPFRSAIAVGTKGNDKTETYIIDQWCILGHFHEDDIEEISQPYIFDLDTYKILTRHLLKKANTLHIKEIAHPSAIFSNHQHSHHLE